MAGKLRVGGVTVDSNMQYNGKEVIRLCNVSFENGMQAAKQSETVTEQALQAAWDRGYQRGKEAHADELTGVLEALKVLKDYFQDT
jgi:hypothetical protein